MPPAGEQRQERPVAGAAHRDVTWAAGTYHDAVMRRLSWLALLLAAGLVLWLLGDAVGVGLGDLLRRSGGSGVEDDDALGPDAQWVEDIPRPPPILIGRGRPGSGEDALA
ncbi:MAG: hypothetical protein ACC662_01105, partial [Planctomycetota bacterium]